MVLEAKGYSIILLNKELHRRVWANFVARLHQKCEEHAGVAGWLAGCLNRIEVSGFVYQIADTWNALRHSRIPGQNKQELLHPQASNPQTLKCF